MVPVENGELLQVLRYVLGTGECLLYICSILNHCRWNAVVLIKLIWMAVQVWTWPVLQSTSWLFCWWGIFCIKPIHVSLPGPCNQKKQIVTASLSQLLIFCLFQFNLKRGGQRVATMLMYLSDGVEGGETFFPSVRTFSIIYLWMHAL